jgi:hypothetical protein
VFRRFHDHASLDCILPGRGCAASEAVDFGVEEYGENDMNTSPNDRDADRHADQLGQDAARADFAEQEFIDHREELAEQLLAGLDLYACGKPLLAFDDVQERVYSEYTDQFTSALKLCSAQPAAGGAAIARIFESAAQDVVDDFESAFRADYELDFDMRDAA